MSTLHRCDNCRGDFDDRLPVRVMYDRPKTESDKREILSSYRDVMNERWGEFCCWNCLISGIQGLPRPDVVSSVTASS